MSIFSQVFLFAICFYNSSHSFKSFPRNLHRTRVFALETLHASSEAIPPRSAFDDWEIETRKAINARAFDRAANLMGSLTSSILPSGRNAVYVVAETCRRSKNTEEALPLLKLIRPQVLRLSEDDVMPLISDCVSHGDINTAQLFISWLESNSADLTAKSYSVLLKGT